MLPTGIPVSPCPCSSPSIHSFRLHACRRFPPTLKLPQFLVQQLLVNKIVDYSRRHFITTTCELMQRRRKGLPTLGILLSKCSKREQNLRSTLSCMMRYKTTRKTLSVQRQICGNKLNLCSSCTPAHRYCRCSLMLPNNQLRL